MQESSRQEIVEPYQDTILVVDDEEVVLEICKRTLTRGGYRVLKACSGREALGFTQPGKIQLALIDVVMPEMNGIELANRLSQIDANIKILLMSGYSIHEVKKITGANNPYRIIWKPFKADSLLRMIQGVLDAPRASG